MAAEFKVGDRVEAQDNHGTVRFYGTGDFAAGVWVGIELDEPLGKNDGSVKGKSYFTCKPSHGIFLRPGAVKKLEEPAPAAPVDQPAAPAPAPAPVQAEVPPPAPVKEADVKPVEAAPAVVVPQTPAKAPSTFLLFARH